MELENLNLEQLFKEYLRARKRGDWERAGLAFEQIAMLAYPDILGYQARKLNYGKGRFSEEDIADLTQMTLERIITNSARSAKTFRGNTQPQLRAYLRQIAANVRNDWLEKVFRRDRIAPTSSLNDAGDDDRELPASGFDIPDIEEGYADLETREIVLDLLSDLSDSHRRIVVMKLYEHAPSKEIADETGASVANVDKVYSRFIARMRERFEDAERTGVDDGGSGGHNEDHGP